VAPEASVVIHIADTYAQRISIPALSSSFQGDAAVAWRQFMRVLIRESSV